MKTTTYEPESPEQSSATAAEDTPSTNDLDPDFDIENTGGPSDGASGTHTGSNPPPSWC